MRNDSDTTRTLTARTVAALAMLFCLSRSGWSDTARPAAASGPRLVMIIRHAEKPDDAGGDRSPDLSAKGFDRAAALARVIPAKFPRPDFLLATKRSAHSNRPVETLGPLAKSLHEPIEAKFTDDQFADLAREVLTDPKFTGKTVLIAWHHGKIPELAHALGATDAPDKWDPALFNRVWEIKFENGKASWRDVPQKALPGDAEK